MEESIKKSVAERAKNLHIIHAIVADEMNQEDTNSYTVALYTKTIYDEIHIPHERYGN